MKNYRSIFRTGIIAFICVILTATSLIAQPKKVPQIELSHPSFGHISIRPNTYIDTVLWYNLMSDPKKLMPQKKYYTRSEDMLTDTMHINNGADIYYSTVYRYNEKNQLLYDYPIPRGAVFGHFGYMRTDYEYDEEGRLIRTEMNWIEQSDNKEEMPPVIKTWDYSTIQKTDKGYIYNNIEVELDDQGRIVYWKNAADQEGMFVEYNGKKYRLDDAYFSYTDSSYTDLVISILDYDPLFLSWMESTSVFNEYGDLKSETMKTSFDGVNWDCFQYLSEYVYNSHGDKTNSGDIDMSNEITYHSSTKVYASSGEIRIYSESGATAQVFDVSGRLVKQQSVPSGESCISVSAAGFYVVRIGNDSFKVFVR